MSPRVWYLTTASDSLQYQIGGGGKLPQLIGHQLLSRSDEQDNMWAKIYSCSYALQYFA